MPAFFSKEFIIATWQSARIWLYHNCQKWGMDAGNVSQLARLLFEKEFKFPLLTPFMDPFFKEFYASVEKEVLAQLPEDVETGRIRELLAPSPGPERHFLLSLQAYLLKKMRQAALIINDPESFGQNDRARAESWKFNKFLNGMSMFSIPELPETAANETVQLLGNIHGQMLTNGFEPLAPDRLVSEFASLIAGLSGFLQTEDHVEEVILIRNSVAVCSAVADLPFRVWALLEMTDAFQRIVEGPRARLP